MYLSFKFVKQYETRYSLRDSVKKLIVQFPRTNFLKNSFSYSGAVLWNSPPRYMREAKSFKYCVHGIHVKQVFYTPDEFYRI